MAIVILYPLVMVVSIVANYLLYFPIKEEYKKEKTTYEDGKYYENDNFFKENYLKYHGISINYDSEKEEENIIKRQKEPSILEINLSIKAAIEVIDTIEKELEFEEKNWEDLKIDFCNCELSSNKGNKALGLYTGYLNKIILPINTTMEKDEYKTIIEHEVAHFIFENKLTYKQRKSYYEKFISKKELSFSEKLELTSFYRADKYTNETETKEWKELIAEQFVEDIKSIYSKEKNNRALERETTKEAIKKLKKEIKERKNKNNTLR